MQASLDAASAGGHTPVLYQNVLSLMNLRSGGRYIDGTVGAGGHAAGILEKTSPGGLLLGLDRDPAALEFARLRLKDFPGRFELRHSSYARMGSIAEELGWGAVDGILLDLGLSSMQVDRPERGFSFRNEGPLDMRFDSTQGQPAYELINHISEDDLRDILWRWGDEPRARQIARAIVAARPIETTTSLAEIIAGASGSKRSKTHPATRSFQAFRIAVNDELEHLKTGLEQAIELLTPGGRLAVIAFHSLEDRIVKNFFRDESKDCVCPPDVPVCACGHTARLKRVTRRAVKPEEAEIERNPRARSARLRVAELLSLA